MSGSRENSRERLLSVDSASQSRSRPASRTREHDHLFLPQDPESLINPDGQISEEVTELLQDFVYPHRHDHEETLVETDGDRGLGGADIVHDMKWAQDLPWWKRPSPYWFIILLPVTTFAASATVPPRIQVLTQLACEAIKPEYTIGRGNGSLPVVILQALAPVVPLDDREWALCVHDPMVQAAVARLSLVMTTAMGILGCLTTTWWGSLSDRYGRMRVLSFACVGALLTDLNFIISYRYSKSIPGGYWSLLVGPIFEGSLGTMATVSANTHAYLTDCTEPASRARIMSLMTGFMYAGMSLGPTVGSLLIRLSGQVLSVFYVAFCVQLVLCTLIWFVVPESLSEARLAENRDIQAEDLRRLKIFRSSGGVLVWLNRMFSFLAPVALFYPSVIEESPLKTRKRDWNLPLLAAGQACAFIIVGGLAYKLQYATMMYGWTAEQLGYWTSFVGAARAVNLIVFLPVIIKFLTPPTIQLPVRPSEPLTPSPSRSLSPLAQALSEHPVHQVRSAKFDLGLARYSIAIETVAYTVMLFASTSSAFVVISGLTALGSGSGPAFSSLMPLLYARRGGKELGKLFGGFAVIQTICSQVLGPFVYGMVYLNTVSTFPQALFLVTIGTFTLSLLLLACIRLDDPAEVASADIEDHVIAEPSLQHEDALVDVQPVIVVEDTDTVAKP